MMIAIDAGNSRIKWGVREGASWITVGHLPTGEAAQLAEISSRWPKEADVVACCVAGPEVESCIEASITPGRLRWLRSSALACGVRNAYECPEQLGADRWAAMLGARGWMLARQNAGACLVVCAGTATTVDWLDAAGNFRGGLILPGIRLMRVALARHTARLPDAEGEYRNAPRNTKDAILSGCLHAQVGAIERMFAQVAAEGEALCLLTGGAARRLAPFLTIPHQEEETLVLDGLLRYAYT